MPAFSKRIIRRHRRFWNASDVADMRNRLFYASEPIEKWKNAKYWQRRLSNKHNAREFAKMHNCNVPALYWKGNDVGTIDFKNLPPNYVIRPTIGHSCNNVFLMKNNLNLFDNQTYDIVEVKNYLETAVRKKETPEFLIEEFLTTENGEYQIPDDYKVFAFNGEIAGIAVINRKGRKSGRIGFYNQHWNPILPIVENYFEHCTDQVKPACFPQIIEHARLLSKAYQIFVRIDFYATAKGAVFGEFTPTPTVGKYYTAFAQKQFKTYWDTYCKGMI